MEDELDTSLPPRPNSKSIPNPKHQILLEPVVALINCTAGNRIGLHSTPMNPSNPIHQLSPEPMVALNGRTNGDGNVVPNQTSNPTTSFPPFPPTSPPTQHHRILSLFLLHCLNLFWPHHLIHSLIPTMGIVVTSNSTLNPPHQPLLQPTVAFDGRAADKSDVAQKLHPNSPNSPHISHLIHQLSPEEAHNVNMVLESVATSNNASDKDQTPSNPITDPINRIQEFQDKWSQIFTPDMPWQEYHLTSAEVMNKLHKLSNSSPGADHVEYRHLQIVDPKCKILTTMFNRCLDENDVPADWKSSVTILIHKKGDASDVTNFRPIALMSCVYKLFMGFMANRLVSFAIDNNLMSVSQKSARPSEGFTNTHICSSH